MRPRAKILVKKCVLYAVNCTNAQLNNQLYANVITFVTVLFRNVQSIYEGQSISDETFSIAFVFL